MVMKKHRRNLAHARSEEGLERADAVLQPLAERILLGLTELQIPYLQPEELTASEKHLLAE